MFCRNNTYFNSAWVYLGTLVLDNVALVTVSIPVYANIYNKVHIFSTGFVNKMSQKELYAKFDKI